MATRDPFRYSRRSILAAVPAFAALAAGIACGGDDDDDDSAGDSPTQSASGPWSFNDEHSGKLVTLENRPVRIVAQVTVASALWDLGIRPIAVYGPQRKADGTQDPQSGSVDLSKVESVGEAYGEFDVEKLASLKPDLLITTTYGPGYPPWYIPDEATYNRVLAICPIVAFKVQDVPVTQPISRFEEVAKSLGADMDSADNKKAQADFTAAETKLKDAVKAKTGLKVLVVAGGPDALYIANPSIATDLIYYKSIGLNIVQPDTKEFWETLSWEQAGKHPADLILNDSRTQSLQPAELNKIKTWTEHPAVKANQVSPWYSEATQSKKSYAVVFDNMAKAISNAKTNVV